MGTLRYGIHKPTEDAANEMIRESLVGVTSQQAKADILTPWKEQDRLSKEVFNPNGVPDDAVRQGMFHRSYNTWRPHLNSREGIARFSEIARRSSDPVPRFFDPPPPPAEVVISYHPDVVSLLLQGYGWSRLQCPGCKRYLRNVEPVVCRGCSVRYELLPTGRYRRIALEVAS